jgi:hypothetical protein
MSRKRTRKNKLQSKNYDYDTLKYDVFEEDDEENIPVKILTPKIQPRLSPIIETQLLQKQRQREKLLKVRKEILNVFNILPLEIKGFLQVQETTKSLQILPLNINTYLQQMKLQHLQKTTKSLQILPLNINTYLQQMKLQHLQKISKSLEILHINIEPFIEEARRINTIQPIPTAPPNVNTPQQTQQSGNVLESIIQSLMSNQKLSTNETKYLIENEYNEQTDNILNGIVPQEEPLNETEPLNEWVVDDSKTFRSSVTNPPPEINFGLKKAIIENLVK